MKTNVAEYLMETHKRHFHHNSEGFFEFLEIIISQKNIKRVLFGVANFKFDKALEKRIPPGCEIVKDSRMRGMLEEIGNLSGNVDLVIIPKQFNPIGLEREDFDKLPMSCEGAYFAKEKCKDVPVIVVEPESVYVQEILKWAYIPKELI